MEQQSPPLNPPPDVPAQQVHTPAQGPAVLPEDRVTQHYVATISSLVEDALKSKTLPVLANVMIYNLARLIVDYGAVAAGHVLERLGSHISYFVERERAEMEATQARNAGHLPH